MNFILVFLIGLLLWLGRVVLTQEGMYFFLLWNLLLAFVPMKLSESLARRSPLDWRTWVVLSFWLLFFPNAPYIITDFIHLRSDGMMRWYDLILIMHFALSGMICAFLSLGQVHDWVMLYFGKREADSVLVVTVVASGLGVYIGRFQRWNSWDIFLHPLQIIQDSIQVLLYGNAFVFVLCFSGFLLANYLFFRKVMER